MAEGERLAGEAPTIRVVLVAHDDRLRAEARDALVTMPDVRLIGEAVEATAAVVLCAIGKPDVVVMEAHSTWEEASSIARRIRRIRPSTPIITCRSSPLPALLFDQ